MKMTKRIISVLLCALLVMTTIAGCGSKTTESAAPAEVAKTEEKADTADAAPAAEASGESGGEELPYVELTWYCCGQPQEGEDAVFEEINAYLKEKINCSVNLIHYDYGVYDEMLNVAAQAGDEFDLCFTSNWLFDYDQCSRKGYFVPMDDLIEKYGQGYVACVPEKYREGAKIDGQTYGVVNYQIMARCTGLLVATDYVDKYNFDLSSVKSLKDMEPLFEQVKADDPSMYGFLPDPTWGLDVVTSTDDQQYAALKHNGPAAVALDNPKEVINIFETDAFKQYAELLHSWYEKGYIRSDAISYTDLVSEQGTGKYVCWLDGAQPGNDVTMAATVGYPLSSVPLLTPFATRDNNLATITAISTTSKNPERAMMFLDLLFSDKYLYNLFCFGLEGTNYEFIDDNTVRVKAEGSYNPGLDWAYGCQFNAYLREGQASDVWEQTKIVNESATVSPAGAFAYDETELKTENAMINAVIEEYLFGFQTGTFDPDEKIPEFLNALNEAGWEAVKADYQKQYDAYLASQQ